MHTATLSAPAPVIASIQNETFITYFCHQIIIVQQSSNGEYEIVELPFTNSDISCIYLDKPKSTIYFVDSDRVLKSAIICDKSITSTQILLNLPAIPISMRLIKSSTTDLLLICYSFGLIHILPTVIFESSESLDSMKEIREIISITDYESSISVVRENISCNDEGEYISMFHRFIKQFRVLLFKNGVISSVSYASNSILISVCSTAVWIINPETITLSKLFIENVPCPIITASYINANLVCAIQSNYCMIIYDLAASKEVYRINGMKQIPLFVHCKIEGINNVIKYHISKVNFSGDMSEFMIITANGSIEATILTNYRIQWDAKRKGSTPSYRYDPVVMYKNPNAIQAGFIMEGLIIIYENECMKVLNQRGQCKLLKQKDPDTFTVASNIIEIETSRPKSNMENLLSVKSANENINKSNTSNLLSLRSGSQGRSEKNLLEPPKKLARHLPLQDLKQKNSKDRNTPMKEALTIVESIDSEKIKSPTGSNIKLPSIYINKDKKASSNKVNQAQNSIAITITNELNCELEDKEKYKLGKYDYNIQSQNILIEECGTLKDIKSKQIPRYQKSKASILQQKIAEKVKAKHLNPDDQNLTQQISKQSDLNHISDTENFETRKPYHQPYSKGYRLPKINVAKRKEIQKKYTELSKHQVKKVNKPTTLPHSISPKNGKPEMLKPVLNRERNIRKPKKFERQNQEEVDARHNSIGNIQHRSKISLPALKNDNSETTQIRRMLNNLERSLGNYSSLEKSPKQEYGLVNALTVVKSGGLNPEGVSNVLMTLSSKRAQSNNNTSLNEEFTSKFDVGKLLSDLRMGKVRNKSVDLTDQSSIRKKPKM